MEFNPITLIAQLISFGIVVVLFIKFLLPMLKKTLTERTAGVSKTFADQSAIETRLAEFDKEQKAAEVKAAEDMQRLIAEAKTSAEATRLDLVAKAKDAAAAEIVAAQKRIEQEKISAEAEVAKHAKVIAQSIVQELLTAKAADQNWQVAQVKSSLDSLKQIHD